MEERELDLVDLFADILTHWRGILVCMLIGGLLLGGFSYIRSSGQGTDNIQSEHEKKLQKLEDLLSESEKMIVHVALDDEQEMVFSHQYAKNSAIMQINPGRIPKIEMIFKIHADEMEQGYMLSSVYEDLVNGVGLFQWVEDQTGISAAVTSELISAQGKSGITELNEIQWLEPGNDYVKVTVIHYDKAECEILAQCVKDYIERQHDLLAREFGAHEVVLLFESTSIVMDAGIRDQQLSYADTEMLFLAHYAQVKTGFTEDQKTYYELLQWKIQLEEAGGSEEIKEETEVAASKPSISLKYVALGAVLFAFIYVGVLFALYILNGKLRTADGLQNLYNISQLGLIVQGGKKKFFVDKWIDTLRNRNKRQFTREQSLELAAAAIKISAGKQELDTICLMGCNLKAGADVVCQELKERLGKENIAVQILDNVLYDAEEMEKLESAKGIVLVEKAMSTMYNEILRELELASRQGITVLGGIVVE